MRRPGSLWIDHPLHSLSLVEGASEAAGAVDLYYAYDGAGNVKSWFEEEYRYDGASRVLQGRVSTGESQSYTYDYLRRLR